MPVSTAKSREQIFSALFDLTSAAKFPSPIMNQTTWGGSARKFIDPAQNSIEAYPFLAQFEGFPEKYENPGYRLPAIRTLGARLFCWARIDSGDTGQLGTQYITSMIEAIENALVPDTPPIEGYGEGILTLGGLVQWCRIKGTILKFMDTDPQIMCCIPIQILWP